MKLEILPKPTNIDADHAATPCDKCAGTGFYCMGTENGRPYSQTGFTCYPCDGTGWKILTAAYVKRLEREDAKAAEKAAEIKAEQAKADLAIDEDLKLRKIPLTALVVTAVWDIWEEQSAHTTSGRELIAERVILDEQNHVDECPPRDVKSAANGQKMNWACQIVHLPTGRHYWVGRTYVAKIESLKASRHAVDEACQTIVERARRKDNLAKVVEEHGPEIADAIRYAAEEWAPALLKDIASKAVRFGSCSEKQAELALKIYREDVERREQAGSARAPEGRQTLTGTILSVKVKTSEVYGDTLKMTVDLGDGVKVWGTAPAPIDDRHVGEQITFTATFQPGDRDPLFGFFSRPRIPSKKK